MTATTAPRTPPVTYPESDGRPVGETGRHAYAFVDLVPLLDHRFRHREDVYVGGNQFLYWVEGDPTRRVAPDVYVLPKVDPESVPSSWQLWEVGPPSFALEVVSRDVGKDYEDAPAEYAAMGARELVIFDPGATPRSRTCLLYTSDAADE